MKDDDRVEHQGNGSLSVSRFFPVFDIPPILMNKHDRLLFLLQQVPLSVKCRGLKSPGVMCGGWKNCGGMPTNIRISENIGFIGMSPIF
jgi:hypothetical protein